MVTQRAVSALAIIERFDVIEDLGTRLGAGAEGGAIDQLELEGAPEASRLVTAMSCSGSSPVSRYQPP